MPGFSAFFSGAGELDCLTLPRLFQMNPSIFPSPEASSPVFPFAPAEAPLQSIITGGLLENHHHHHHHHPLAGFMDASSQVTMADQRGSHLQVRERNY